MLSGSMLERLNEFARATANVVRRVTFPSKWRLAVECLFMGVILSSCASMPSDEGMISQFDRHRPNFERIVKLAQEERGIERISSKFVRLDGIMMPTEEQRRGAISDTRLQEYRELFQRIHDPDGIGLGPGRVYFYIYDAGMSGSGVSKGIVWSRESPGRLVENLDHFARSPGKDAEAWRPLGGGWYLEYDANG